MDNDLILERLKIIQNEVLELTKLLYSSKTNNEEVFNVKNPVEKEDINLDDILRVCGSVERESKRDKKNKNINKNINKKSKELNEEFVKFGENFNNEDLKEFFNVNEEKDNENNAENMENVIINPIDLIDKNKDI